MQSAPPRHWGRRSFWMHLGLYLTAAVLLAAFNRVVHHFPWGSGAKIISGMAFLGLFAAMDLSLSQGRRAFELLSKQPGEAGGPDRFWPIPRKLSALALVLGLLLGSIFFLVVNKDLDWMLGANKETLKEAQRAILLEFGFVVLVALGHLFNLILSFAKNLGLFFESQSNVLAQVAGGSLERNVPVASNDEFGRIAHYTNQMITGLKQVNQELGRTQEATILALASLAETRDNETGAHVLRTQRYVRALAETLAQRPEFAGSLSPPVVELLYKSAPLHDIGKVGIADAILLKPGKHTDEEFAQMKQHALLGAKALEVAEKHLGGSSFLKIAKEIAWTHHEKWDGSGYPRGLKGEEIPLAGRLMAIADVYDALISKRVYKPAFSHQKAVDIIAEGKGSHFDPLLVTLFFQIEEQIKAIAQQYGDQFTQSEH
ncbi:MAG: HD domain-containing phosphohydrolase [bacterium]|nr:HD domain-containing phosphohydrolase [bacterium]